MGFFGAGRGLAGGMLVTLPGAVSFLTCCGPRSEPLRLLPFGSCQQAEHIFHGPSPWEEDRSPTGRLCARSLQGHGAALGAERPLPTHPAPLGCLHNILSLSPHKKNGNSIFSLVILWIFVITTTTSAQPAHHHRDIPRSLPSSSLTTSPLPPLQPLATRNRFSISTHSPC